MADKEIVKLITELKESIEALETRNAFQDDVIDQLNHELSIHQNEIAELKEQLQLVVKRLKDSTPNNALTQEIEPPPPHY